ncbi:ATP-binding protein [Blastopirellula marina]|uniref:histidine kinase n=1 Tax=Blastopirellula marina DSM 3645 TaxID=314230 RepID=A4A0N7_9BACT|nr:ATP-binding protein [Blastopirellula marina]EAQ77703.1 histidine protein kinase [Blastopirellula marina DSM 3645]
MSPIIAPPLSSASAGDRMSINAAWLIKLRWVAVFGQLITILVVGSLLHIPIRWVVLFAAVAVTAGSNILLTLFYRRLRKAMDSGRGWENVLLGVMLLDLFSLTALLYFTGGMTNPFCIFYMVNLTLAAIVLPGRSVWWLAAITAVSIAFLFYDHVDVPLLTRPERMQTLRELGQIPLAQTGMYVAFLTCIFVIVYFTTRLTDEVRRRDSELRRAELQRARSEKLESLGTLAAGAAHELSTPLATIAVVAKEVQRELAGTPVSEDLKADIALIRTELDRCRHILDQMSADAGQATGEPLVEVTSTQLAEEIRSLLDARLVDRLRITDRSDDAVVRAPRHLLAQSLRGLIKNAFDASPEGSSVVVLLERTAKHLVMTIQDEGPGMPPEILSRIGEPFFTTKEPGSGTGLGIFLAKNVIERIDGALRIESNSNEGTTVVVQLLRKREPWEATPAP